MSDSIQKAAILYDASQAALSGAGLDEVLNHILTIIRDHFQIANLCGYPAVSVPNGFTAEGRPTSITFVGRLYAEAEMLALARAYQERAGFHLKHPRLT